MHPRHLLVLLALLAGCGTHVAPESNNDEQAIRQAFTDLQKAVKDRDGARLWDLLAAETRQDAERVADTIKASAGKADGATKAELAKRLGVPAADLGGFSPQAYLQSNLVHGKLHEISDSKIEKVAVKERSARLTYVESDGDHESLGLVREDGRWKFLLALPGWTE
jgi:hypothetical protein